MNKRDYGDEERGCTIVTPGGGAESSDPQPHASPSLIFNVPIKGKINIHPPLPLPQPSILDILKNINKRLVVQEEMGALSR